MANAKWRFFYHWRKCDDRMSIHFRGACMPCDDVKTDGVKTETKRNKRQPRLVIQGFAKNVRIVNGIGIIE